MKKAAIYVLTAVLCLLVGPLLLVSTGSVNIASIGCVLSMLPMVLLVTRPDLVHNWRDILAKAWSSRLMIATVVLSGLEVGMPFAADAFPRGLFAVLAGIVASGALLARIVYQRSLHEPAL